MALNVEQLTEVARLTFNAGTLREAVDAVRQVLPQIRTSSVDAFDMRHEAPALHIGSRNLYLMESDGHCWSVTADPAKAVGIVITQN